MVINEQEQENSIESIFSENGVELPNACKADPSKVPSVDIKMCVKEAFGKVQGYLKSLEQISDIEPGLKKQEFELPTGE
jgi:hypothetical protein